MSRKISLFAFTLVFLAATDALADEPLSFTWLQPSTRTVTAGTLFDISVGIVGTQAPNIETAKLTILQDGMVYATVSPVGVAMGDVNYPCKVSGSYTFPNNAPTGNYSIQVQVYASGDVLLGSNSYSIAVQAP
jgi:hypothetical protein